MDEKSDRFVKGQLVVISIAKNGLGTNLMGDKEQTANKQIWIYPDEYLVGEVAEKTETITLGTQWKILTSQGIAHIMDEDICDTDLEVVPLTEPILEWLILNCKYDIDTGKHTLDRLVLALRSYMKTALLPMMGYMRVKDEK